MLTNFFNKSKFINTIVIVFLFFLVAYYENKIPSQWDVLPFFLLLFCLINFITLKNRLTLDSSYMFLFFILLICYFPQSIIVKNNFYVNLLILFFLRKVYSLKVSQVSYEKLFDGSFWLGISFLIEPNSLVFLLFLFFSMYVNKKFTIKALIIAIIGFIIPVFLFFVFCFWYDKIVLFNEIFNKIRINDFSLKIESNQFFLFFFVVIMLTISLLYKILKTISIKNKYKKKWLMVLVHFFVSVIFILFCKKDANELLVVIFPSSIILANGIEVSKNKIYKNIIIALFFIAILYSIL